MEEVLAKLTVKLPAVTEVPALRVELPDVSKLSLTVPLVSRLKELLSLVPSKAADPKLLPPLRKTPSPDRPLEVTQLLLPFRIQTVPLALGRVMTGLLVIEPKLKLAVLVPLLTVSCWACWALKAFGTAVSGSLGDISLSQEGVP